MRTLLLILICTFITQFTIAQNIEEGRELFNTLCTACHETGTSRVVGPGLKGISEKRDRDWIIKFVRNSSELITTGDPDAVAIFAEYNNVVMNSHDLTDEQIDNIIAYIDHKNDNNEENNTALTNTGSGVTIGEDYIKLPYIDRQPDRWMTIFAGLILLICTFVVTYSYSLLSGSK